jgi:hypothetical protein
LTGTGCSDVDDRLAHGLEEGPRPLEVLLFSSDHDRKRTFNGPDVPTGDWGI